MSDTLKLLQQRDQQGIIQLQEEYGPFCYSIIYQLLRNHEQTEEALNDVWMQIWNSVPEVQPVNLRAYLAKTARNTAIHYVKHNSAQKRSGMTVLLDELEECIPDPQWECDREGLKETLRNFVNSLKPEEQQIFLRRYWYGDTIEELAKKNRSTQNRITGILFRIRNKLRKRLKMEGYEL